MRRAALALVLPLLAVAAAPPRAHAQAVAGQVFVDLDADGLRDPGETGLADLPVVVFGPAGETSGASGSDGTFSVNTTTGCRAVFIDAPAEPDPATGQAGGALRRVEADSRTCPPDASVPVGLTRYGVAHFLRERIGGTSYKYIQLGDSIAAGVSVCFFLDTDYSPEVASELDCLGPSTITRDNRAVGGWHSEDLLTTIDDRGRPNPQYIPNVVAAQPDLVTMSIGGNDFLNTEPGQAGQSRPFAAGDLQRSFQELIHTRRSVQEILSVLVSELPGADIEINSVYDNLAPACSTTDFHAAAPPMWNQMLRHLAWGQRRTVQVGEAAPDFAHENVTRTECCGNRDQICALDNIHPNETGADIIQHAVMESLGRVQVGASGVADFDAGWLPLVAVLRPYAARVVQGAGVVTAPDAAVALDGNAARVGPGGVLEVSGFSLPVGITPVRLVVGVRYKTTAAFTDDTHLFDASLVDFAPPQWTFTGWDTVTPLVGGSGTEGNLARPSVVNALPNVPAWRDVTAMVTKNAVDDGTVTGTYAWPLPTGADVAALKVRLSVNAVGTPDGAEVEWDGAWLWVYGTSSGGGGGTAPGEVSPAGGPAPLRVRKAPGIEVSWGAEPLAESYRIWRGTIGAWTTARCDPGVAGGCVSAPTLTWIEPVPPEGGGSWYFLVSAVNTYGDGPVGYDSFGNDETTALPGCP